MNRKIVQPVEILLVEDSPTDVLLAKEAFEYSKIVKNLHTAADGVEAMAFLRREGKYKDAPCPGLILLDLNLPRKDGREVLAEIKTDELLKRIPVVVLTTSKSEADVLQAYGLHANCYIVKPVDFEKFAEVVKHIENFWFSVVTLPGGTPT
jgi:two-component system, chemotaxis family, response regulator Rcp1